MMEQSHRGSSMATGTAEWTVLAGPDEGGEIPEVEQAAAFSDPAEDVGSGGGSGVEIPDVPAVEGEVEVDVRDSLQEFLRAFLAGKAPTIEFVVATVEAELDGELHILDPRQRYMLEQAMGHLRRALTSSEAARALKARAQTDSQRRQVQVLTEDAERSAALCLRSVNDLYGSADRPRPQRQNAGGVTVVVEVVGVGEEDSSHGCP